MSARHVLSLFAILSSLLVAGCSKIGFAVANIGVHSGAITSVEFDHAHALSLDVFRPQGTTANTTAKTIVFFYGGSWRNGARADYRFVGQSLAKAGFLVIVPDYRKAPQVVYPAFIDDSARAVAWTKQHAGEYGGDPAQIFLMGHSSGAHMAAMLGTDAHFLQAVGMQPRDLAGIVGLAGPYDFLPLTDPKIKEVFGPEVDWPKSQPVNFVSGDEPPFLLVQGTDDKIVWPRNAPHLAAKLRAANEPVTLDMIPGTGHVGLLLDLVRTSSPVRAKVIDYIKSTRETRDATKTNAPPQ